ncbi:hypothetical protein EYF80_002614 [Liparis tanakae]|uniref:Uncharacterized protein n=1 Tax=Liparis tanakae TaxID=230148 RepID=A0A4Z2JCB4_9TELE|nr:hypothetical protein EYF80_002614 [Liparis tanakae]
MPRQDIGKERRKQTHHQTSAHTQRQWPRIKDDAVNLALQELPDRKEKESLSLSALQLARGFVRVPDNVVSNLRLTSAQPSSAQQQHALKKKGGPIVPSDSVSSAISLEPGSDYTDTSPNLRRPASKPSTGAATRLFNMSFTLIPLLGWLMLMMEEGGFSTSTLGHSDRLSCDFFTSEDSVDMSGPAVWSTSDPLRMLASCSSPIPESEWGRELSLWRMSRYLETMRTEMKYTTAKARNWACLLPPEDMFFSASISLKLRELENTNTSTMTMRRDKKTWTSLSSANNRSVSSLWCMEDHLNSGMRNMVVLGPGLNCRLCSSVMSVPLKPKSTPALPVLIDESCPSAAAAAVPSVTSGLVEEVSALLPATELMPSEAPCSSNSSCSRILGKEPSSELAVM